MDKRIDNRKRLLHAFNKTQQKITVKEVILDLNKLYADEWLAHYQYWLAAHWISGIDSDAITSRLTTQSADELLHAERFANRIIELGREPVIEFVKLSEIGGCRYKSPPKNQNDLKTVIENVLEAERCAIEYYNKMVEKYKDKDIVTYELFRTILIDEVSDEDEWENLLDQKL